MPVRGKNAHRLTRVTVVIHNHEKIFFIQSKKPFNMVRRFNLRVKDIYYMANQIMLMEL